jgi:hypothetical protein
MTGDVECVMNRGQIRMSEAHFNEYFPHDDVEGWPIVYHRLGHLVPSDRELGHEGQDLIGKFYLRVILSSE